MKKSILVFALILISFSLYAESNHKKAKSAEEEFAAALSKLVTRTGAAAGTTPEDSLSGKFVNGHGFNNPQGAFTKKTQQQLQNNLGTIPESSLPQILPVK